MFMPRRTRTPGARPQGAPWSNWSSGPSWSGALLALCAVLLLPAALHAQGTVRGTVTDSATGRPVSGVQITVVGGAARALTGEAGTYQLVNVPAGNATVRAARIGYSASERTVSLSAGGSATADFTMRQVATILSTVVAVGYGSTQRATVSSAISSVDSSAIARIPVAGI